MKVRNSFVSNSSSSSFIVFFPNRPKSIEELQKMLFEDQKEFHSQHNDDYWNTEEITKIVFGDLSKEDHSDGYWLENNIECIDNWDNTNIDQLFDLFQSIPTYPFTAHRFSKEKIVYQNKCNEIHAEIYHRLKTLYSNTHIGIFEYWDDTSMGAAMEHSDLFHRLPHIRISQH